MISETISTERARQIYDKIGARYDWFSVFESRARRRALSHLALRPGWRVLNVGAGTGQDHAWIHGALGKGGLAAGVDISWVMTRLAAARSGAPMLQGDARFLPIADDSVDLLYSAYLLDLVPGRHQPAMLAEFGRVLVHGGRLLILSLTEGVDPFSRGLVGLWKSLYRLSPVLCAGCRPVRLQPLIQAAGFGLRSREVIVQVGLPSEIVEAVWAPARRTQGEADAG